MLGVYAHLFDQANHAAGMRDALSAKFGGLLNGDGLETTSRNGTRDGVSEVIHLSGIGG
jgi:hypothetical protein